MKFNTNKTSLLNGLQTVQNVVNLRSTLPILANVLIVGDKNGVSLTTTDLDVSVRCRIEAEVSKTGGSTQPARRLFNIVRELPDSPVRIEIDDKDMATVESDASFFRIVGLSKDEFPPMAAGEAKYAYHLDEGVFREMRRKTAYAASTDESRPTLNGVLLSFKGGKLTVVATDGRRLALVEHEVDVPKEAEGEIIVPTKTVSELLRLLREAGPLTIQPLEKQVTFEFNDIVVVSKLIEGTYPNYSQVIPAQCEERVTIAREALLTALRRVSLVTADRSNAAKLTFEKNNLTISVLTPDVGEARETLPLKYGGKEISVAFNPDFMMDPLRNLTTDEVALELTDELSPGVIKCEIAFLYVLMPMRIT